MAKKKIPAPHLLRKLVEEELKTLGWRIASREQTGGALKAWLVPNGLGHTVENMEAIGVALASATGFEVKFSDGLDWYGGPRLFGEEFELEDQRPTNEGRGLFLACYRKGRRGIEYAMGMDV
jgi:hypothetical protein